MFSIPCPTCKQDKIYRSKKNLEQGRYKNCKSCRVSVWQGGTGSIWSSDRTNKKCKDCLVYKTLDNFRHFRASNIDYKNRYNSICKECKLDRDRFRKYGLTKEMFNLLQIKQDYKCAICILPTLNFKVDHDHKTGKVRGLLCDPCNTGIGLLKENIENLRSAIKYIESNGII